MKKALKKIKFSFVFASTFLKKHKGAFFLSLIIGLLSSFWIKDIPRKFPLEKIERIGYVGKFTLDKLPQEVQEKISMGLTTVEDDGHIRPQIANSWKINQGGKEIIFTLKDNIFWHDNTPLKAQDINYNFNDVAITVINEREIKFNLKEPFSPFLSIVSKPIFKKESIIGLGEYKINKIKRNGKFIQNIYLVSKNNKRRKIIIKFYPTEDTLKTAFKLGEIDTIKEISSPEEFSSWSRIKINPKVKYNQFAAIFFNTRNTKFSEKTVRQALAYALQKKWPYRALTPINPYSWTYNPNVKSYDFNLENAKKLLEKAKGNNQKKPEFIEISTLPSLIKVAEEIKNDWEKLGINCKIKIINSLDGSFEVILAIQEIPSDPDQYVFWHSTQQELNISGYKSPKIDKLLEDGRKIFDEEKRKEIYRDFQKSLVEETPAIFLFHPIVYNISKD